MLRVRQIARRLGIAGIIFTLAALLFILFYFFGNAVLLALDLLLLIPAGAILIFRVGRYLYRQSLWSVRNRLLCVYTLFGVLPVLLLFILFAITGWSLISELAIYLATSALNRRVDAVNAAVTAVENIPFKDRRLALPRIDASFVQYFPDFKMYVKDTTGAYTDPSNAPELDVSPKWGDVNGLLFMHNHFYAWAHHRDRRQEITVVAPLSDEIISNLVPNLGIIALVEEPGFKHGNTVSTGSLHADDSSSDTDFRESGRLPPPMGRFDFPVALPSVVSHYHLDAPNKLHDSLLWVRSRPSAVMRAFFSDSDLFRGILYDVLIGVAILFLLVEIGAVVLGISLSTRITRAVSQIYEGTRRVIRGDFAHRIPVGSHDQLGELAASFNQMTGNVERLLLVEKERERLQAEIEIAREVQGQLYPHHAPPRCGLQLTARCDPARMVSGDYYDYQMIGRKKLAFAIGDVAGKGISAALLMATIQAALRAQVSHSQPLIENECTQNPDVDCAQLVSKLNRQVWEHTSPEKYATFFFGVYDEPTGALTYTNAGHLSPLLFRNGKVVSLDSNGTVVGAFPNPKYDASCISFEPGDLLICYTDGITEPENNYEEMFGEERLIELIHRHAKADDQEIIRIVFEAVRNWTGTPELHDDMTLLLARHVGHGS